MSEEKDSPAPEEEEVAEEDGLLRSIIVTYRESFV